MMKNDWLAMAPAAIAVMLMACPAPAQTLHLDRIGAVADSLAGSFVAAGSVPGMTVAVARGGEIVFTRGYGKADMEMGVDAGPRTVYGIRSVTKQLTAAAVMRLVEAGRVSLDDPITKHIPEYPAQGRTVTVRHLLNHTSGIADYRVRSEARPNWLRLEMSYADMMALWGNQPFVTEPGTAYDYNSMGYWLLGEIVTRVAGMPFDTFMERELIAPLGLRNTHFCDHRRVIPNRARGYEHEGGALVNAQYVSMTVFRAGGSFCSTAADLIRWTHLLHAGRVVSPASVRQMTSPAVLASGDTSGYGFGLKLDELGGHTKVHHGGTFGFGAYVAHYPEDGLTIAILTNSTRGRAEAEKAEEVLARAALGIPVADLPLTPRDIARYEGTYTLRVGERTRELRVFGEEGRLKAQYTGGRAFGLRSQGRDLFIPDDNADEPDYQFTVRNGRAEALTMNAGRWATFGATRNP